MGLNNRRGGANGHGCGPAHMCYRCALTNEGEGRVVKFGVRAAAVALSAATMIAATMSAQGAGALAVGTDAAQPGALTYGWTANYPNEGEAKYQALVYCLSSEGDPMPAARADCKLITVFNKQCMSFSWDPKPGATGWGWAVNVDKSTAEKQAIDKCNAMPGASRTGYCATEKTTCDTTGSGAPTVATAPSTTAPVSMVTSAPTEAQGGKGAKKR